MRSSQYNNVLLLLNFEHICIDKNSAFDKLDLVLLRSFVKIQQSNKSIIKDKETISQSKSKNVDHSFLQFIRLLKS